MLFWLMSFKFDREFSLIMIKLLIILFELSLINGLWCLFLEAIVVCYGISIPLSLLFYAIAYWDDV